MVTDYAVRAGRLRRHIKDTSKIVECPECGVGRAVWDMVIHLNDGESWTREAIADWLDDLGLDLTVQPEPVIPEPLHLRIGSPSENLHDLAEKVTKFVADSPYITQATVSTQTGYPDLRVVVVMADGSEVERTAKTFGGVMGVLMGIDMAAAALEAAKHFADLAVHIVPSTLKFNSKLTTH